MCLAWEWLIGLWTRVIQLWLIIVAVIWGKLSSSNNVQSQTVFLIVFYYISTKEMLADIFTKALPYEVFIKFWVELDVLPTLWYLTKRKYWSTSYTHSLPLYSHPIITLYLFLILYSFISYLHYFSIVISTKFLYYYVNRYILK